MKRSVNMASSKVAGWELKGSHAAILSMKAVMILFPSAVFQKWLYNVYAGVELAGKWVKAKGGVMLEERDFFSTP